MKNTASYIADLKIAFDARRAFENAKAKDSSSNIHKTLAALEKSVTRDAIAKVFVAHNIDANLINRAVRADSRINVYAFEKIENVASALLKAQALNHYSRAILATAKALTENDMQLTNQDAQSACTLDFKLKDAKREKLVHKYQKHVAYSTATTQSSSSLEALCTFNILKRGKNESGETVYILQDNESAKALCANL
jgi:hypothetical protein